MSGAGTCCKTVRCVLIFWSLSWLFPWTGSRERMLLRLLPGWCPDSKEGEDGEDGEEGEVSRSRSRGDAAVARRERCRRWWRPWWRFQRRHPVFAFRPLRSSEIDTLRICYLSSRRPCRWRARMAWGWRLGDYFHGQIHVFQENLATQETALCVGRVGGAHCCIEKRLCWFLDREICFWTSDGKPHGRFNSRCEGNHSAGKAFSMQPPWPCWPSCAGFDDRVAQRILWRTGHSRHLGRGPSRRKPRSRRQRALCLAASGTRWQVYRRPISIGVGGSSWSWWSSSHVPPMVHRHECIVLELRVRTDMDAAQLPGPGGLWDPCWDWYIL